MTCWTPLAVCCALLMLLELAHAERRPSWEAACATEAERKLEVEKLDERIDWFLSIVEEVPEGIARQFRAVNTINQKAFRQAIAHPLWSAHQIRERGAKIKRELRPRIDDREARLQGAIEALEKSASFSVELSDYANQDQGRRILDKSDWASRYTTLPWEIALYVRCLVADLVSSAGAGSGSPAAPR